MWHVYHTQIGSSYLCYHFVTSQLNFSVSSSASAPFPSFETHPWDEQFCPSQAYWGVSCCLMGQTYWIVSSGCSLKEQGGTSYIVIRGAVGARHCAYSGKLKACREAGVIDRTILACWHCRKMLLLKMENILEKSFFLLIPALILPRKL